VTCSKCKAGLFETNDQLECSRCSDTTQYWDGEKCKDCEEEFPFCAYCTMRSGEFECLTCLGDGSVKFKYSHDDTNMVEGLKKSSCGCDDASYVAEKVTGLFDPSAYYCSPCSNSISKCSTCNDLGSNCTQC